LEGLAGMLDRGLQLESFKVLPKESACEGGKTRLLVLHGTGDHVNAYEATKAYVDRCSGLSDKELKSYDGWYHNSTFSSFLFTSSEWVADLISLTVHAEPGDDKLAFANHVSEWILQRSGSEESKSKL
jgi:acylglycerol lipase